MRAKRTRRGMTSCPVLGPNADVVRILRCTALLLDLVLVIRAQGKHSCGVTFPDRLIGVDVNSPLSTPAFAEISFGQREPRHVSYGFQRNKASTHIRFCRNGCHRSSLPRGSLSLDDLANAARQHHQLVDRHDGHCAVDDLFEPGGFTPATAARRASHCRVSWYGGAALSLFQCLARPSSVARDEFLRANVHRRSARR